MVDTTHIEALTAARVSSAPLADVLRLADTTAEGLSGAEASAAYQSVGSQLASSGVTLPGITAPATTGHTAGRSYQIRKRRRENLERQMR